VANKNLFFLTLAACCIFNPGALAQEQLIAPMPTEFDSPLPQMALPDSIPSNGPSGSEAHSPSETQDLPAPAESPEDGMLEPFADPINSGDLQGDVLLGSGDPLISSDREYVLCEPALLESTGTWLRRGFWYTEFDIVITDRIWRRDSFELMGQNVGRRIGSNSFGQPVPVTTRNSLLLNGGQNGAEAAPRLKLGRFLFRDHKNRDHAVELVAYGGGQWSQNGRLDANPNFTPIPNITTPFLEVNDVIDRGNASFTGATSAQFEYDSRFNSFEMNYHVSSRMQRDRMELEPSGRWVRRAQPSVTWSLIAGLRYVDLNENLDWDAFGIPDADGDTNLEQGTYDIRADNDMIGSQLGFSWTHERARWSLGAEMKGGIFLNRSNVDSAFEVTGNVTSGNNRIEEDNMSFLSDAAVLAKWHLRPNVSLRVGLDLVFLTSLALAPETLPRFRLPRILPVAMSPS